MRTREEQLRALAQVLAAVIEAGSALRGVSDSTAGRPRSPAARFHAAHDRLRRLLEEGRGQDMAWTQRFDRAEGPSPVKAALRKVAKAVYSFAYPAAEQERDPAREEEVLLLLGQAAWDLKAALGGADVVASRPGDEAALDRVPGLREVWPSRPDPLRLPGTSESLPQPEEIGFTRDEPRPGHDCSTSLQIRRSLTLQEMSS